MYSNRQKPPKNLWLVERVSCFSTDCSWVSACEYGSKQRNRMRQVRHDSGGELPFHYVKTEKWTERKTGKMSQKKTTGTMRFLFFLAPSTTMWNMTDRIRKGRTVTMFSLVATAVKRGNDTLQRQHKEPKYDDEERGIHYYWQQKYTRATLQEHFFRLTKGAPTRLPIGKI